MAPRDPHISHDSVSHGRWSAFVSAVLMLALLTGIGAATLLDMFDGPGSPRDERVAATPAPPVSASSIRAFPGAARFYLGKRYALKDSFIRMNAEAKIGLFGHSPYERVLIGRDGVLFLGDDAAIGNAQGATPAPRASDEAWLALFREQDAAFRRRGIPLVQILAPDKHVILPEKLPEWLVPVERPRVSHLAERLAREIDPPPVDIAALFAETRREHPDLRLYHATDTHWTELGAALGVDAALAPLGLPVPGDPAAAPLAPEHGGDLARIIGRQEAISDTAPRLPRPPRLSCEAAGGGPVELMTLDPLPTARFTCRNPDAPAGHALVFMDSFGMAALPRLNQIFRQVDYVWSDRVDMALVDELAPDLAVRIMVARKLQDVDALALGGG